MIFEAIVENYTEYRDYNSTTTQSDRGDLLYTLFDFLRLRVQYDRMAWHLEPVLMAHEILVRRGRMQAAEMWRTQWPNAPAEVADTLAKQAGRTARSMACGCRRSTIGWPSDSFARWPSIGYGPW